MASMRALTIGMRGDGDKPMTQGTAIGLLERIVLRPAQDQLSEVTGSPSELPSYGRCTKKCRIIYDQVCGYLRRYMLGL